jgi:hypothetical protein
MQRTFTMEVAVVNKVINFDLLVSALGEQLGAGTSGASGETVF